jgi:hypothetical protein
MGQLLSCSDIFGASPSHGNYAIAGLVARRRRLSCSRTPSAAPAEAARPIAYENVMRCKEKTHGPVSRLGLQYLLDVRPDFRCSTNSPRSAAAMPRFTPSRKRVSSCSSRKAASFTNCSVSVPVGDLGKQGFLLGSEMDFHTTSGSGCGGLCQWAGAAFKAAAGCEPAPL